MTVLWAEAPGPARAGFAVSRHVATAVRRNRVRRRLREAYRLTREAQPDGTAVVIIGKPAALDAAFSTLVTELREALGALTRRAR